VNPAAGRGLTFAEGESNLHCVACGGGYAWAGCATSPSLALRIDPASLTYDTIAFPDASGLHDFSFDGSHLWVAHASGHLSRLEPGSGDIESWNLSVSSGQRPFAYCVLAAAGFIWVGFYTDPATVLRIDPATDERRKLVVPEAPMWSLRDLAWDGQHLWASVYDVPGRLIAIEPELDGYEVVDLGQQNLLPTSLAFDGERIWAGLDSRPARLVALDPETHEFEVHVLHESSSAARGLCKADGRIWAGLYTQPAQIARLDRGTGEPRAWQLPAAYFNVRGLAADGEDLWAGLQNVRYQPSAVFAMPLDCGDT